MSDSAAAGVAAALSLNNYLRINPYAAMSLYQIILQYVKSSVHHITCSHTHKSPLPPVCVQGLRRYLLLGQGDFIQHLMDLLE